MSPPRMHSTNQTDDTSHALRMALVASLLVLAALSAILFKMDASFRKDLTDKERTAYQNELKSKAINLHSALNARFSLLQGLKSYVSTSLNQVEPGEDLLNTTFEQFAAGLRSSAAGIRNFIIAPQGINRYVHPLQTNQKALGHNLLTDKRPQVRADVQRAIRDRSVALSGPYELRQGGLGIVSRAAVFEGEKFWGIVSMVIDVPPILADAKLTNINSSRIFAIADSRGEVFHGAPETLDAAPVTVTIPLPEGQWTLAMAPAEGWGASSSPQMARFRILAGALALLAAVTAYLLTHRQIRLNQEVDRRTAELSTANDELRKENDLRKEAERAADAANRSKTLFLANMSHEIRTPLNGITGMHQLLQLTELTERQANYVDAALRSSTRLTALLGDVLDLTRIEAGHMRIESAPFALSSVLDSVEELFGPQLASKDITLHTYVHPGISDHLEGDHLRLQQILFNLVANAIKFTSHGSVAVEAYPLPSDSQTSTRILFAVSDTGEGIAEANQQHIFKAFTQAEQGYGKSHQGAGLGLAIVNQLVELMGGEVSLASTPGKGTTVHFCLTMNNAPAPEQTEQPSIPTRVLPAGSMRVLLAEDDSINRMALESFLKHCACEVVAVQDGEQALQCLSQTPFNLVLMDIQMPVMDGIAATRAIRDGKAGEAAREVPIVALTAYAMDEDRESFLAQGMNDHLSKPVLMPDLENLLDRYRPAPGQAREGVLSP